jgi:hypothetical protein
MLDGERDRIFGERLAGHKGSVGPTWMYGVALNTAIVWTRKEDRHQRGKQPLAAS